MKDPALAEPGLRAVRVWDLPTRVFHWTLVGCVFASFVCVKIAGNAMIWHTRLGYAVFALLAFRLLWGFAGGRWSRFASFVYSPATVMRYVRGECRGEEHVDVGHNPLGSASVFALLLFLALQVASGLFADDEIATTGPWIKFVAGSTSQWLTTYHKTMGQWVLVTLVALHVVAIVVYRVRLRKDLVGAMVSGDKLLPADVPASADSHGTRALAVVLLTACAAVVACLVSLGG
jgi:cytochrome b